jgi:NAD(P)-dependent dehydrogenase (short-subunit alcohol dehydrogenase family)
MSELRFDGRSAIVTGGGRGVGRIHALSLAARGARVVVADLGGALDGGGESSQPADEVVKEIQSAGGEAVACYASVADEAGAASIVQTALDAFGRLDVVINNAGISTPELFENQTLAQIRRLVEVHYLGTVYVTKAAWPHLVSARSGRIVNTCSEGPLGIHEMMTGYGGAKGGVLGFTLGLAAEADKYGIGVNGFSPRIATRMSAPDVLAHVYGQPAERFEGSMNAFPPELASPAAIYLAHESCPLNGVVLVCGGGDVIRMAVMENQGVRLESVTPETVAANIDAAIDMTDARIFGVGGEPIPRPAETAGEKS